MLATVETAEGNEGRKYERKPSALQNPQAPGESRASGHAGQAGERSEVRVVGRVSKRPQYCRSHRGVECRGLSFLVKSTETEGPVWSVFPLVPVGKRVLWQSPLLAFRLQVLLFCAAWKASCEGGARPPQSF